MVSQKNVAIKSINAKKAHKSFGICCSTATATHSFTQSKSVLGIYSLLQQV